MFKKYIYLLPLCSLVLMLNACSSTHTYSNNFGFVENLEADEQLRKEAFITRIELQKFHHERNSVTEFKPEKGTFLAEDWVQPEPVITYKYLDDSRFYREDELPENKARLGNVVVKVPGSMSKEEFLLKLESGEF